MIQVNVRIDEELKEKADALFDELGLNMTTAFVMFLKASLRDKGLPFRVTTDIDENVLHKQIIEAINKRSDIKTVELEADENGNIIIDKDLYPELYDWAVNG